ncbi:nuclear transport factor 2 family protein [Fulvivirga maritima]|uniref:nuclear transport factor 2 family protein n=1 Tax=Fulvivirga maritima TaxID=2904247 RepID=UPI001F1ACB9A|nr:nuclear transport factor 2 family protein [Fulvivirga maritima]UII29108.1 nuclear transport factor 2 family protein [Fulvivirga maritima]
MNLPPVVTHLVRAQDNFDSVAYSNCFSATAVVHDEGKTYQGKAEIQNWIDKANKEYQVSMEPVEYDERDHIMNAKISGNFPGSPVVLSYHFDFEGDLIKRLKIV